MFLTAMFAARPMRIACLIGLLSRVLCADDAAVPVRVDLFTADQDGYALYRIPGVVVTARGTVLVYCEARRTGTSDWDTIDLYLRRSTDGGRTFERRVKLADHPDPRPRSPVAIARKQGRPEDVTYNNPVCITAADGAVHLLYCLEYMRCFHCRSDDDGASWSPPVEITAAFEGFRPRYDWKVLATGPGHAVELRNGRLVVPVWLSLGTAGNGHNPSVSAVIYSDDAGQTWHAGDIVSGNDPPIHNSCETSIAELSDGRVLVSIRNHSDTNRRVFAVSPDGSTGWSAPQLSESLVEPVCMAGIVSRPAAGDRPALLIFSNPDNLARADGQERPGGARDRRNLTLQLSRDNGATWYAKRVLEPGPSAYSDVAVLPSGDILCFYERATEGSASRGPYGRLTLARFPVEWIAAARP